MSEHYASGNWMVSENKEDEFIKRWSEFLTWTRETQPGLISASLTRRADDPSHFVSIAEWSDAAARAEWKKSAAFQERFGACRALCREFDGGDYDRVVQV